MFFPFNKSKFEKAFWVAFLLAILGWVLIYIFWGEFTPSDIIGMLVATPLMAYMIHVLFMFNDKE